MTITVELIGARWRSLDAAARDRFAALEDTYHSASGYFEKCVVLMQIANLAREAGTTWSERHPQGTMSIGSAGVIARGSLAHLRVFLKDDGMSSSLCGMPNFEEELTDTWFDDTADARMPFIFFDHTGEPPRVSGIRIVEH